MYGGREGRLGIVILEMKRKIVGRWQVAEKRMLPRLRR